MAKRATCQNQNVIRLDSTKRKKIIRTRTLTSLRESFYEERLPLSLHERALVLGVLEDLATKRPFLSLLEQKDAVEQLTNFFYAMARLVPEKFRRDKITIRDVTDRGKSIQKNISDLVDSLSSKEATLLLRNLPVNLMVDLTEVLTETTTALVTIKTDAGKMLFGSGKMTGKHSAQNNFVRSLSYFSKRYLGRSQIGFIQSIMNTSIMIKLFKRELSKDQLQEILSV